MIQQREGSLRLAASETIGTWSKDTYWVGRRVLITGGTGFVGSWLTKALVNAGSLVTIMVHDLHPSMSSMEIPGAGEKVQNIIVSDIRNQSDIKHAIRHYEVDTCFHLAAQAIVSRAMQSPDITYDVNVRGTVNVLEACRSCETVDQIVVASSDKAYGEPLFVPITELHPLLGSFTYDASKACADMISRAYHNSYSLPVAVARCSNIYGGGDTNFSRIVPGTIMSVLLGKRPMVRSDGRAVRDYMYISDAVSAYLLLCKNVQRAEVKGEAFNFGTSRPVTVLEIVTLIAKLTGGKGIQPIVSNSDEWYIKSQYLSTNKAAKVLGWTPQIVLEKGLLKTISWYRRNASFLKASYMASES